MRSCLALSLVLLCAFVGHPTTSVGAESAVVRGGSRTLYGKITGARDNDPVNAARVLVVGKGIGTVSDQRGVFRLSDVPDGAIRLRVQHPCFLAVEIEVPVGVDAEVSIGLPSNPDARREAGCGGLGQRSETLSSADSLALERTLCFGTCPAYRLRLARDGAIDFQSQNPGESTRMRARVAPETLRELVTAGARAGFFSLPTRVDSDRELCAVQATDQPSVIITVYAATTHSVAYYTGCRIKSSDPASTGQATEYVRHPRLVRLSAFANAIDSTLGSARWVRPAARR